MVKLLKTMHMRLTVLELIRDQILKDKSEMEGRFEGEGGGEGKMVNERL